MAALIAGAAMLVLLMPADWASSIQTAISSPPPATPASAVPVVAADEPPTLAAAPVDVAAVPTDAASAAIGDVVASAVVVELPAPSAASALPLTATAVGPLQLKASAETWVEVVDGESRVLVSRMLASGEALVLDGASPFKVKIGNAAGTKVAFRGQVVDLASSTRDNVARLELK